MKKSISIVMGSDSDLPVVKDATKILSEFGVPYEIDILSAHRAPDATLAFAKNASKKGVRVIIAAAGGAAHLAGVIASHFPLPVIGIPIKSSTLSGIDSLYSIVQMPPGIPVATVGINGAQNASLLAIQILATSDKKLEKKLVDYKKGLAKKVLEKSEKLKKLGVERYLLEIKK
ncbi:5-(carboxyamino)imidazole ribonucleotide mutase [Candidatus Roizmanbacteria bacterium CG09_land_8_20_14_0_10_41_9]|uniref:N5-carboxyaminoimidazole ribonucleotide mutase n=1 Tax=Candidatus Roizmanbacteria bacterium CG09_land_8_20_14_0_10_41_9 TaxID=1974850 RepID=A0A2H0WTP1_9BACT|nr:MAG: 5-(carboxyamino)imidazole ribonucleotide mutase [Candidatus Roizmanbacteria bacterium CG09_land_8_20_14_0_10_41_9]